MKTLAKFVMLLAVLAFCLPADGEILIYRKTMKCFGADGDRAIDSPDWTWDAGDERVTGYLILEVEYDGNDIYINNAEQVEYWREGRERYYEQIPEGFGVERIEILDRWGRPIVHWVLEDWETWSNGSDGTWFVMLRGKARLVNIGLGWTAGEKREVASMLEGCAQYWERWLDEEPVPDVEYIEKSLCCETLRLHPSWTRLANLYWDAYIPEDEDFPYDPFDFAVGGVDEDGPYGIVKAWLEWLGYEEIGEPVT